MRKIKLFGFRFLLSYFFAAQSVFANTATQNADMKTFIDELMSRMTLEEKIGQLNLVPIGLKVTGPDITQNVDQKIRQGLVGGVFNTYTPSAVKQLQDIAVKETRLKIPLLFGFDVIHGHRTIFPMPLALSASWNLPMIENMARVSAIEASADGLHWTFSPMVDISRDPRWGRVMESAGEDSYLGALIAKAMVKGYQGTDLSQPKNIMACVKHFALYGAVEAGRDYNTVDMSPARMYNEYFPPYKAAIDAGVATVMSTFNEVNGIPSTGNHWLMQHVLRDQFDFKGFVVTDYSAVTEMREHGSGNAEQVTALAINAPIEMDMADEMFITYLPKLVKEKKVSEVAIDRACRLILEAKWKLGLFQNPYKNLDHDRSKNEILTQDHLNFARDAARQSMVLLKNSNQTLPLHQNQKIAFIGPFVKDKNQQLGEWRAAGIATDATSLWDAIEKKFENNNFFYAQGANFTDDPELVEYLNQYHGNITLSNSENLLKEALSIAKKSDVIVAVLGEPFGMSGEAASRSDIHLLKNQTTLLKELKKLNKPIVLVLMNGRPLALEWENKNMDAILEAWFAGTQTGPALVDVLFGNYNPSAKITMTFPRDVGQIPIYYNSKNTGRPYKTLHAQFAERYKSKYLDVLNTPLYPFGYGLSYTKFEYGNIELNQSTLTKSSPIQASIKITNTGNYDGEEIVQMYIHDVVASLTRPVKELKSFKKIKLKKNESTTVVFNISADMLRFYSENLEYKSEPGEFKLFIGTNSRDVKETSFVLK